MEWYGIQHWHIKQFVIHELCRSGKLKRTELHFQQHKFTVSGSQGNRRSHPSYHQPTYHSSKAATTSKTSHNLIGTQLSKWLCTARQHLLLPPMAVQEQRPVDGGEVEEHDQQNQQVINESKEPQHTCRMQNQGRDVIWIYLIVLKIAEVSLPKKKTEVYYMGIWNLLSGRMSTGLST